MKVTYSWLKELLNIEIDPQKVGQILTQIGLEVENIESTQPIDFSQLTVGEVIACEQHPNADRLKITKVKVDENNVLQIVCGAANVAVGQKVCVAKHGSTIQPKNGTAIKIKKGKIRGEESEGMLCAEDEIGLSDSHAGIIVMDTNAKVGDTLDKYYNVEPDHIYTLGITPNRSDALSVLGIANDLLAYCKTHNIKHQKTYPTYEKPHTSSLKKITLEVKNTQATLRYSGIVIENVTVTYSPTWVSKRLHSLGLKSINNIVDAGNLVMIEMGQPLHAFDYDLLNDKKIIVETEPKPTEWIGLDNKLYVLQSDDICINDTQKTLCVGGIYGGINSGVNANTKNVFIESAVFNAKNIRKTSMRLGIRSDAAIRFEKAIDPTICVNALYRYVQILKESNAEILCSEVYDLNYIQNQSSTIDLPFKLFNKLTGLDIDNRTIESILSNLQLEIIKTEASHWQVKAPNNKPDVKRPEDIIEEIIRIYGLDNIPIKNTIQSILPQNKSNINIENDVAVWLSHQGFHQIICNSLCKHTDLPIFNISENENVYLLKSINKELDVLRPNLLVNALHVLSHNFRHQVQNIKVFEFGKIYTKNESYNEEMQLLILGIGEVYDANVHTLSNTSLYFYIKGILENVLEKTQVTYQTKYESNTAILEHNTTFFCQDCAIAEIGILNSNIANHYDIDKPVIVANVAWEKIQTVLKNNNLKYKPYCKFPYVQRDLAIVLPLHIQYNEIEASIANLQIKTLINQSMFDNYYDNKKDANHKSYGIRFVFQHQERTLTDLEIDDTMNKITEKICTTFNATIRN